MYLTIIKYAFSLLLSIVAAQAVGDAAYFAVALAELALIWGLTNWLAAKWRLVACILSDALCLLFNIQLVVLFFGNTYVQLVMLSNLNFLGDLGGKAFEYGSAAVLLVAASVLPIRHIDVAGFKRGAITAGTLASVYALALACIGISYSPLCNYGILGAQAYKMQQLRQRSVSSDNSVASEFYSWEIEEGYTKEAGVEAMGAKPNVIVVFCEGLSQNIVDDERNIMPNLRNLEQTSLYFDNYYNHSFATLRGLIGQFYSGYQLDNYDENNLISLQEIMSVNGYSTTFINSEPGNEDWNRYLEGLKFDELLGSQEDATEGAAAGTYSDGQMYDMLLATGESLNQTGTPFFLSMYTFGTHASLDTAGLTFGDGTDPVLNKFYNTDYELGRFLEAFNNSALAENTVLVFTTDHATYQDSDFSAAFPAYSREHVICDEVPLCIYYKGIEARTIDAKGRNTLDMAPTLLDFLDINSPNYFLGTSLFCDNEDNTCDTVFNEETINLSTEDGEIRELTSSEERKFEKLLYNYFDAKAQKIEGSSLSSTTIKAVE